MPDSEDLPQGETRKLAAIMFTDMVGFSRLMHQDEELALRLLDECNAMIADAVAEQRGRVLKKMGDAVLAEFPSATNAVTCAVQIQSRVRDYNADRPEEGRIALRIGIHVGDVVIRDEDLFGDGINVAARLEPLSEPGGICLSEAVYQAVAASSTVKPILVGEVELKNILQRHVVYRIPSFYAAATMARSNASGRQRSLHFGAVERIEALPPPRRSFLAMLTWSSIAIPVGFGAGIMTGAFLSNLSSDAHRLWPWELVEPASLVTALQERTAPLQERIWESLDRDTRDAINTFEVGRTEEQTAEATYRRVRRSLNALIEAEQPLVGVSLIPDGLDGPEGDDFGHFNRSIIEAAFPGSIQRYVGRPSSISVLARALGDLRLSRTALWLLLPVVLASVVAGAYSASLKTLRIHFRDIRDVDALLDYYIRDLGFREARREGDELVFRATLWTWFLYTVLRMSARVSGNTVVITGPAPMMRRLTKRMLLLAE
ncbi:MAG TPA: adenylate/guanylate cyclase domain-containing protein [Longimicrobiaceae bacterium]|nr:adenylate/guanylate cyclase domain-containing protein [Longimicrobiaceae bacterium]